MELDGYWKKYTINIALMLWFHEGVVGSHEKKFKRKSKDTATLVAVLHGC